jgi:hypothetical protein
LLRKYYNIDSDYIPQQREKSNWIPENNFGFLLGIIAFGMNTHITQLHSLLVSSQFEEQEQTFIDSMFDWYIRPFHKSFNENRCNTPSKDSSRPSSRPSSAKENGQDYQPKELSHKDLKQAVVMRDGVCLFCWDKLECEGAHIIAQKNIPIAFDEQNILTRAGLSQKHQINNGLLLCQICHSQFDKLKRYVDVADDKLVVKVVNETNDENDVNYKSATKGLKGSRRDQLEFLPDNRQPIEANGEMALYFVQNNLNKLPNRQALEFHKAACLIWRMAGGAEPEEEYCSDDEDLTPVDTAALKRRFIVQDSAETLNIVS